MQGIRAFLINSVGILGMVALPALALAIPQESMIKYVKTQSSPAMSFEQLDSKPVHQFTSGTGFYVTENNIITNEHVVQGCKYVRVRGAVTPTFATIKATDPQNDLALLETKTIAPGIAALRGNATIDLGEDVMVMGYPLEHGVEGTYLIRKAQIQEVKEDTVSQGKRIHFTDSVNKGNSGGPLLDSNGTVVGVVVGKMSFYLADMDPNNPNNQPVKTTSLAIDLNILKNFLSQHNIFYRTDNTKYNYADGWMENKAKNFIVNIHCIRE